MRIEHIAIWAQDINTLKAFYEKYFLASAGEKYVNQAKHFESYFLSFKEGARLEIMQKVGISKNDYVYPEQVMGLTHLAISVGSKIKVDALTEELRMDGYQIVSEPRLTGDGYYESVVLDPEGNRIEITV